MRKQKILLLVLRIIISLGFALAGIGKFIGSHIWANLFKKWGFFDGFYLIVGAIEVAAAIGLFIPKISRWAIYLLGVILIGASITHLIHDPLTELLRPCIYLILLMGVFILDKKHWSDD